MNKTVAVISPITLAQQPPARRHCKRWHHPTAVWYAAMSWRATVMHTFTQHSSAAPQGKQMPRSGVLQAIFLAAMSNGTT